MVKRQGRGVVLLAHCAAGELALVSPDCLMIAPASLGIRVQPPTPQEQQQVEDWLKVKVQFHAQPGAAAAPTGIADPAGLPETGNGISDSEAQSKQMKLAAKAAGDETYRVARDNAQKKCVICTL